MSAEQARRERIEERALIIAAQCWCDEENKGTEMNSDLARAFAKRMADALERESVLTSRIEALEKALIEMEDGYRARCEYCQGFLPRCEAAAHIPGACRAPAARAALEAP